MLHIPICSLESVFNGDNTLNVSRLDLRLRAEELLRYKQWSPEQIVGRLRLEGLKMVGKSTLYKWLHQDKRADMRFYLDMVKHSLDYLKGEKVSSQASFLVLAYTYC